MSVDVPTLDDRVMDRAHRFTYTEQRKLHPDAAVADVQRQNLKCVIIHNAFLTDEVSAILAQAGVQATPYFPLESSEAHFYVPATGDLHVVNSRGVTRMIRDIDLVGVLREMFDRKIDLEIYHYHPGEHQNHSRTDAAHASKRFGDFAHDLVTDIFTQIPHAELRQQRMLNLFMGPHKSLAIDEGELVAESGTGHLHRDYLQYKILRIGGQLTVAFDYIFADQASNVLQQVYATLDANFSGIGANVFHYGKIGILNSDWAVRDICLPTASLDEKHIAQGDFRSSPIHNALVEEPTVASRFAELIGEQPRTGITINTTSVLQQTHAQLERDLAAKGDMVEMEWATMAGLEHGHTSRYPRLGSIRYFFAGVGSDKPLSGETLGNVTYDRNRERQIVAAYKQLIREAR